MNERKTDTQLTREGFTLVSFNPTIYARQEGERIRVYRRAQGYDEAFDGLRENLPPEIERLVRGKLEGAKEK